MRSGPLLLPPAPWDDVPAGQLSELDPALEDILVGVFGPAVSNDQCALSTPQVCDNDATQRCNDHNAIPNVETYDNHDKSNSHDGYDSETPSVASLSEVSTCASVAEASCLASALRKTSKSDELDRASKGDLRGQS